MNTQTNDPQQTSILVSAKIPVELHARFDAICESQYRSKASTIIMLLEQYCTHIETELTKGG